MANANQTIRKSKFCDGNDFEYESAANLDEHLYNSLRLARWRQNVKSCHDAATKYLEKFKRGKKQDPDLDLLLEIAKLSWECNEQGKKFEEDDD